MTSTSTEAPGAFHAEVYAQELQIHQARRGDADKQETGPDGERHDGQPKAKAS